MIQISLMDYYESCQPKPKQLLNIGETIWIVTAGDIEQNTVEQVYDCQKQNGYHIKNGSVWDDSVGRYVFKTEIEAQKQAAENLLKVSHILASDIMPTNQRSFFEGRIYATVAMVGELTVYHERFMEYHLMYEFKTPKEAARYYKETLKKIMSMKDVIELEEQRKLKNMYRIRDHCGEAKYAHYRFG